MLRWWRGASTRAKASITLALGIAGCIVLLYGLAALNDEDKQVSAPTPSSTILPTRTLTSTVTFPAGTNPVVSTVTITEAGSTVPITPVVITQASGGGSDHTIAIALISAGALIIGSSITATSAIIVARSGRHT
jgi:hypothetical protein